MQSDYRVIDITATKLSVDNRVLRNTYMLLGITMFPTVVGAYLGVNMSFIWAAQHPVMFALGSLALLYGLFAAIGANRNSGLGVFLLLLLTGVMGVMLGPLLQVAAGLRNGSELVMLAAGGTGLIFITLAGIAATTKKDLGFLGNFLMVGLILLIVGSLVNLFFQAPVASLALSGIAIFLFSGLILFDVNRIVRGGETNYVMATLALYLDIYNLFVNLLQMLMALLGNRD